MDIGSRTKGAFAISALLCAIGETGAQDWPQWRGANRDGKAAGFTAPATWPQQLTQKWKVAVGDGVATPSLVGDKLYVFARQKGDEIIRCLDAASGKEVWQDKYPTEGPRGPDGGFAGPRCSPTVAEGKVVTLGVNGVLSAYDATTGAKLWRKNDSEGSLPMFHTSSSPIVVDGMCVSQFGGRAKGGVVAYDLQNGTEKWRWSGDGAAYASPAVMTVGGSKLIVAQTNAKMVALTATDGKLVWEAPFEVAGRGRGYNASSPIIDGQTMIYCGSGRGATAVKFEKNGDNITAKELWKNVETSVIYNTPVVKDGHLFGLTATNEIFCLNMDSGKLAWSAPLGPGGAAGNPPPAVKKDGAGKKGGGAGKGGRGGMGGGRMGGSAGYGSIVDAGSVLLALTPGSQLVVFAPNDKSFQEVARIKVASTPTYAYPVLAGHRLFVKDQDSVMLLTMPGTS